MIAHLFAVAAAAVTANPAHAKDRVGVVVAGDASLQAPVSAELASWLQQQGHPVEAAPLSAPAVNGLLDCFVLEDTACASRIVDDQARSDAILYVRVEAGGAGPERNVTVTAHWIAKHRTPGKQKSTCKACSPEALQITLDAMLATLSASVPAPPAAASAPAPVADVEAAAPAPDPARPQQGLALGIELGEPTSATVGLFTGKLALLGAIGSGTFQGPGLSAHIDAQLEVTRLAPSIPLRVGLGGRFYHHGYQPMSVDEIPHEHYGLRASAALAVERGAMQLYAEVAPGIDLKRSASCTLADGPRSVCPHAQSSPLFVQLVLGARFFITH